jgi:bacillithiol system protein YtxJ
MMRLEADIPLIDVRRAHALSRAVEERTGVRHESPQVIVPRRGRAGWSASHGGA